MFLLYTIETKIDCPPEKISMNFRESVLNKVDECFAGKIIKNEGICISVYDMKIIQTTLVEGYFQAHVSLRLIVFKPFIGEILTGKIIESTQEGIEVDLIFVSAFIPAGFLNESSSFDELEGVFVWHYEENDLFYDKGEVIRFKVNAVILPQEEGQKIEILGKANEDGLGLIKWWS
ncbi:hypothetical protein SteCoe_10646 [Stentor coeruleus]|uniref:Uncharacterized protein n=1 Tax=Stentor coeruleus TaxID=5963 RepID=A0A1R2CEX1_9CILI|nr:hypothetical protein SteCoe_10646 [Stentor coeruleus]